MPDTTDTPSLTTDERADVLALVDRAAKVDGASALSEQSVLALRGEEAAHLLRYAATGLAAYAQLTDDSAELVVDPAHRRSGLATELLSHLPGEVRVWAHGDGPSAEAFAAARSLVVVRELWVLGRRLDDGPELQSVALPTGLVARSFEPGRDEDEWVRVNAAAFAHHPEQGRMTRVDLEARMAEPWFEAAGLILVVPEETPDRVAAFHWTKVHPAGTRADHEMGGAHGVEGDEVGRGTGGAHGVEGDEVGRGTGEVYVVGVDPAYQGRGLGRPLTLLGLHHLRERGLRDVILYVDGDNPAALKVYRGLGFTPVSVDRMYARSVAQSSPEGGTMTP